ncbi:hypothetical protein K7432_001642 [Basidiobolus ranarum]|uniref:Nicotianamine synthase n=1 Tax=Basidiobolus ranarum TaxID=34480 RepID=A0ABR2W946_9FUNG
MDCPAFGIIVESSEFEEMLSATEILPLSKDAFIPENSRDTIERLYAIYSILASAPLLDPSPEINSAFTELVGICIKALPRETIQEILEDEQIVAITNHFRQLCASGEFRLELTWATYVTKNPERTAIELMKFPYYNNYVALAKMELNAIHSVLFRAPKRIAFLGSGPLPLTSICLARELINKGNNQLNPSTSDFTIENYDIDLEALKISKLLTEQLSDVQAHLTFHHQDINSIQDLRKYDVVYLAALVGLVVSEKRKLIQQLWKSMSPGSYLVLRSAHSLRKILYPEVETEMLQGFEPVLVVHPYNEVVNSIVIAKRL